MDELTVADFERAAKDKAFRDYLIKEYGIKDSDLPPLDSGSGGEGNTVLSSLGADETGGGYGMLSRLGHKVGVALGGIVKGTGDVAATLSPGLLGPAGGNLTRQPIEAYTERLAAPLPQPETPGDRILQSSTRGATSTGGLGGPLGALSGATGGMAAQTTNELGGGPLFQMTAGAVGGLGPGILRRGLLRRDPTTRASTIVQRAQDADTRGPIPDNPNARVREYLGLRVAGQGGTPANRIGEAAKSTIQFWDDRKAGIREGARAEVEPVRSAGQRAVRTGTDAIATTRMAARDEVARLRDVERQTVVARQAQADQRVAEALRGATGDRVADAIERLAGLPKTTAKQLLTQAEESLRTTGREMFGALDDIEVPPSEVGAPIFDALGDPLLGGHVRAAYNTYAPQVPHNPRFQELQKAYQLLGAKARSAARNGGALPNGDLMTDLYAARDALGEAMEKVFPDFRKANASYRAKVAVVEGVTDGVADASRAKAADIADRMRHLAQRGGEDAVAAYRMGLGRGTVDRLREMPVTRDAAGRVAAAGSDEAARLRMAFPDEGAYQRFVDELDASTGAVTSAREAGRASVASVGSEFAQRRAEVRGQSVKEVKQIVGDVRATQDATRRSIETIRRSGRERLREIPSEEVQSARRLKRAAQTLDVPERGRPLKGGVELAAGARARGIVDLIYGMFGKKTDPEDVRQLLADYLLAEPDGAAVLARQMREAAQTRKSVVPLSVLLGAQSAQGGQR